MEKKWACPSEAQRFCKNDSDSSQVILWNTWFVSSHHRSQRGSRPIHQKLWLESSYWLESRYHWYLVLYMCTFFVEYQK